MQIQKDWKWITALVLTIVSVLCFIFLMIFSWIIVTGATEYAKSDPAGASGYAFLFGLLVSCYPFGFALSIAAAILKPKTWWTWASLVLQLFIIVYWVVFFLNFPSS